MSPEINFSIFKKLIKLELFAMFHEVLAAQGSNRNIDELITYYDELIEVSQSTTELLFVVKIASSAFPIYIDMLRNRRNLGDITLSIADLKNIVNNYITDESNNSINFSKEYNEQLLSIFAELKDIKKGSVNVSATTELLNEITNTKYKINEISEKLENIINKNNSSIYELIKVINDSGINVISDKLKEWGKKELVKEIEIIIKENLDNISLKIQAIENKDMNNFLIGEEELIQILDNAIDEVGKK